MSWSMHRAKESPGKKPWMLGPYPQTFSFSRSKVVPKKSELLVQRPHLEQATQYCSEILSLCSSSCWY